MAAELKRCYDKYPHFQKRIRVEEQRAQKDNRFLRWSQIACLIYEITERGVVTKGKGLIFYNERKTGECFQRKTIFLVQEDTLVVFYTRMPRETVRQRGKRMEDARTSRLEQASSSVPTGKGQTDDKRSKSLEARPATRAKMPCLWGRGKM